MKGLGLPIPTAQQPPICHPPHNRQRPALPLAGRPRPASASSQPAWIYKLSTRAFFLGDYGLSLQWQFADFPFNDFALLNAIAGLRLRRSWQRTPPPGCSHHRTRGKNLHHQNRAQGASRARTSLQLTQATRQRRITLLLQQDWPPNINYDKLLTRAHLLKPLARLHTGSGG